MVDLYLYDHAFLKANISFIENFEPSRNQHGTYTSLQRSKPLSRIHSLGRCGHNSRVVDQHLIYFRQLGGSPTDVTLKFSSVLKIGCMGDLIGHYRSIVMSHPEDPVASCFGLRNHQLGSVSCCPYYPRRTNFL